MNRNFTQVECGLHGCFANRIQLRQFYSDILLMYVKNIKIVITKTDFNEHTVKMVRM